MKEIRNRSQEHDFSFYKNHSVSPPEEYKKYSFAFMWAMHNINFYLEELFGWSKDRDITIDEEIFLEKTFPKTISIDNCMRIDSLKRSWLSNKHLINFQMLSISGHMAIEEAISKVNSLLNTLLVWSWSHIFCKVHSEDIASQNTLIQLWIPFEISNECIFNNIQTDRFWYRIEFFAGFTNKSNNQEQRELLNIVNIKSIKSINLNNKTIIEWGWSLERILCIQQKLYNVFELTKYSYIKSILGNITKLVDIAFALISFKNSGYIFSNNNKKNKTYRELWREFIYTMFENNFIPDNKDLLSILNDIQKIYCKEYEINLEELDFSNELWYKEKLTKQYLLLKDRITIESSQEETIYILKEVANGQVGLLNIILHWIKLQEK